MYRLYHKIPKGLEPVANVFKQVGWLVYAYTLFYYQCLFYILVYFTLLIPSDILMLQHITAEGTALVQQAEDAATNQVKFHAVKYRCNIES